MFNKDFLKQVLAEDKSLMEMKDVKFINVPVFDELSVKNLWPEMQGAIGFMKYFPDKLPKGRLPNRDYFFNVMNSVNPEYVSQLVRHANEARNSVQSQANALKAIEVSEGWFEKLNAAPYVSRKCNDTTNSSFRAQGQDPAFAEAGFQASAATAEAAQGQHLLLAGRIRAAANAAAGRGGKARGGRAGHGPRWVPGHYRLGEQI